jgi:hypothetical protein
MFRGLHRGVSICNGRGVRGGGRYVVMKKTLVNMIEMTIQKYYITLVI